MVGVEEEESRGKISKNGFVEAGRFVNLRRSLNFLRVISGGSVSKQIPNLVQLLATSAGHKSLLLKTVNCFSDRS